MNPAFDQYTIVFYDGECGLCDQSVTTIWKNDPYGIFFFMPLQSEQAEALLKKYGVVEIKMDTMYLYDQGQVYSKSVAVARILKRLPKLSPFGNLLGILPQFLGDAFYTLVSKNRHRLFPKKNCELPPENVRERFL